MYLCAFLEVDLGDLFIIVLAMLFMSSLTIFRKSCFVKHGCINMNAAMLPFWTFWWEVICDKYSTNMTSSCKHWMMKKYTQTKSCSNFVTVFKINYSQSQSTVGLEVTEESNWHNTMCHPTSYVNSSQHVVRIWHGILTQDQSVNMGHASLVFYTSSRMWVLLCIHIKMPGTVCIVIMLVMTDKGYN